MTNKIKNIVVTITFFAIIIVTMIANLIKKDELISISERRKLEQKPQFTLKQLTSGKYSDKLDKYVTDQFIQRENLRKTKVNIEKKLLKKKDYNNLYDQDGYIIEQNYPLNTQSVKNIINKINQIANEYLTEENNIYYTIIPDKNYFASEDHLKIDYSEIEKIMSENLNKMKYINIKDELNLNDYYKTDTHWKQENIVKIAKQIAQEMNIEISKEYTQVELGKFKGTYSGRLPTNNEDDNLIILTNEIINNCTVYNYETQKESTVYDLNKMSSLDKYNVYLSGATPLLTINNPNSDNNKELIIFRDSFGSSITPLILTGYSKVTLVDTRYMSPKLINQYIKFTNQDILFMYSTLIINNSSSLKN